MAVVLDQDLVFRSSLDFLHFLQKFSKNKKVLSKQHVFGFFFEETQHCSNCSNCSISMKTLIICFLAPLLMAGLCASATNYYVDPSASGSNKGTYSDPWQSLPDIPATINYFLPGDTVFFRRGQQYTGTLSINSSGSYNTPIVFMPYGSGNAPLFQYNLANPTESSNANRMLIRLNQVNYIVIDGFELTDASIPENDHTVTANVGHGVYIYGGPNNNGYGNTIKNLTISRLGGGITIDGGTYNTIADCSISNLRMIVNTPNINYDDYGATGITLGGSNNTIVHNNIQDCWAFSYDYQYDGGGVEMYGAVNGNNILYNTAINNMGFMEFGSGTGAQALNNLVAYNLLINNGDVCWINAGNGFNVDVRNLQLFNNNIVETNAPRIADVTSLIGIFTTPSISNVINMKNNIFWITTSINITDPVAQPFNGPQLVHQNNLYHLGGGSLGYTADGSELKLNPHDSLFMDITTFGNPAAWNYKLRQYCAAINFGQVIGINQDYFGQTIPVGNAPDAGIAEHVLTAGTTLPLKILSCKGWATTNGNNIEWVTNNDTADHFEVEKSIDGNNFKTIGVVPYKANTGSADAKYDYVDNDVTNDVQYYRIKVIEHGNTGSYSQIVTIKNSSMPNTLTVSPNPAQSDIYLRLPGDNFSNKEMVLFNIAGVELRRTKFNETTSQVKLNVSMLPQGTYIIKVMDYATGKYYRSMFVK
jgi:hypothetical protein